MYCARASTADQQSPETLTRWITFLGLACPRDKLRRDGSSSPCPTISSLTGRRADLTCFAKLSDCTAVLRLKGWMRSRSAVILARSRTGIIPIKSAVRDSAIVGPQGCFQSPLVRYEAAFQLSVQSFHALTSGTWLGRRGKSMGTRGSCIRRIPQSTGKAG
jgi:hypothetical protein